MATSANWNVIYRPWLTTLAPIFTSFSHSVVNDQCSKFYNSRGTEEQYTKEGKNAINWTRHSCHSFRTNEVRLQLHALAYNLGNRWNIGR